MARSEGLYDRFASSVAPSIYGNVDIKKAVTCLLMGGSKKILPDGMRLRGDVNVLLLGDPGTAKSQLLKFVEKVGFVTAYWGNLTDRLCKVSPISVYTSGKGSSAAGLTASVQRDPVSVSATGLYDIVGLRPIISESSTSKAGRWSLPTEVWCASTSSTKCEMRIGSLSMRLWSSRRSPSPKQVRVI